MTTNSIAREVCPYCGEPWVYLGLLSAECGSRGCVNYVAPSAPTGMPVEASSDGMPVHMIGKRRLEQQIWRSTWANIDGKQRWTHVLTDSDGQYLDWIAGIAPGSELWREIHCHEQRHPLAL